MAATKKMSTAPKKTETEEQVVEEVKQEQTAPAKKAYSADDPISTTSVTSGLLVMEGLKTGILYRWIDAGDKVDVEYADIMAAIRSGSNYVYKPRFVIDNDDIVSNYKNIQEMYDNLYDKNDLMKILALPSDKMKDIILQLPDGVKKTIQSMAITAIERKELDSVQRIKTLDEIFGTQMLLKLTT